MMYVMGLDGNNPSSIVIEEPAQIKQPKAIETRSRLHFFGVLAQTILISPITSTLILACRTIKLITWDIAKASIYKISGFHTDSADFLKGEYLKTVKAFRDLLFIPSVAVRAFQDLIASPEEFIDDLKPLPTQDYLKVGFTKSFQQFSSDLHGCATFEVIHPTGITEFPAIGDPTLKTVMASNIFRPGMIAINFGMPNVASFITEEREDGSVQTIKVDAKSLWREPMGFHPTNGKIQTGVFLFPTNLPHEALARFKQAAEKLAGTSDRTCVNTNCKVLKDAGFAIENVSMDGITFPETLMEHLLFRNVFYTDSNNIKHKVHFDILNTTERPLEKYFEDVDTAVVGTRLRHALRHADTEEDKKTRGEIAKLLIADEAERLAKTTLEEQNEESLAQRKVTISVPSCLGDAIASVWGRHTMYELDLSDKQQQISESFEDYARSNEGETAKLCPFPHENPSFATRLKRDVFFSGPMIRLLRRHMMGRADVVHLSTQGIFKHIKSTKGAHLNYALLDNKLVIAKVNANEGNGGIHKAADWALSKHALLANREDVFCSGEIWYDETQNRFMMNGDSGTYTPDFVRVQIAANLANDVFDTLNSDIAFKAVKADEEGVEVTNIQINEDEDVDSI